MNFIILFLIFISLKIEISYPSISNHNNLFYLCKDYSYQEFIIVYITFFNYKLLKMNKISYF